MPGSRALYDTSYLIDLTRDMDNGDKSSVELIGGAVSMVAWGNSSSVRRLAANANESSAA